MKDAFGGIINLVFLVVFLLIVIGVLGLVFSYTKAFKMKNVVISTIEEYEGAGCITEELNNYKRDSKCVERIKMKSQDLAYGNVTTSCPTNYVLVDGYYCFQASRVDEDHIVARVMTQVNIDLPIINRVFGLSVFRVSGDTKRIYYNQ